MRLKFFIVLLLSLSLIVSACTARKDPASNISARSGSGDRNTAAPDNDHMTDQLPAPPPDMAFAVGIKLPSFTLTDLSGKKYTQDIFSGQKLTVINFWGTY